VQFGFFFRAFRGSVSKDFVRFLPPRLTNKTIDNLRNTSQNIGGRKLGSSIFENQSGTASDKLKGKN